MRLKDQVALLTNCMNPVGQAIALALAGEGAYISLADFSLGDPIGEEILQGIEKLGRRAMAKKVDIPEKGRIQMVVDETREYFGRIDILVNHVGGLPQYRRFMEETQVEHWEKAMVLGLKSAFLYSQAVIRVMQGQKRGKIINLFSGGAKTADELSDFAGVTAQAGILGLTRQFAHQLGPFGINVNAIAAGLVLPGWRWEREWEALKKEKREAFLKQIPLRRFGRPDEVARVVAFLASDDSSYISGATIEVTGGQLMPIFAPRSERL